MVHSLLSGLPEISDEAIEVKDHSTDATIDRVKVEQENYNIKREEGLDGYIAPGALLDGPVCASTEDVIVLKQEEDTPEPSIGLAANQTVGDLAHSDSHTTHNESPSNPSSLPLPPSYDSLKSEDAEGPPAFVTHPHPPKITLSSLLSEADDLYTRYPPNYPSLSLSSIMGPQSVVFTWSESASKLPSDSTAEAMVTHPELVVYPYVEVDTKEELDTDPAMTNKQRRKRRKLRKTPFSRAEKRTMVAGAVLVLGVAMAVYGIKTRSGPAGIHTLGDAHAHSREWRRVGGWVGGMLVGASERILNGFGGGS